jgi:hypothetical protein
MPEKAMGEHIEVPAPAERFPYDKHAEEKDHYVNIDRCKGIGRCDLTEEEDCNCSAEHDLPDPQREPAHLPHSDEEKDRGKDNDCDIRSRSFSHAGT